MTTIDRWSRASLAAARASRHRQRQRLGRKVVGIEIDEIAVVAGLIDRGFVSESQALDDAKVAAALGRLIAETISGQR